MKEKDKEVIQRNRRNGKKRDKQINNKSGGDDWRLINEKKYII